MARDVALAVDLGASGGRVMAVHFDGKRLEIEEACRFPNGGERRKQARFRGPSTATDDLPLFQNPDPQLMVRAVLDLGPQDFRLRGALTELAQRATPATVGADPSVGPGIDSLGQRGRRSVVGATVELGRSGHTW
jgi:hypothetical protein